VGQRVEFESLRHNRAMQDQPRNFIGTARAVPSFCASQRF
jgi:hypothetical protein